MPSSFTEYPLSEEIFICVGAAAISHANACASESDTRDFKRKRCIGKVSNRKRKNSFFWNTAMRIGRVGWKQTPSFWYWHQRESLAIQVKEDIFSIFGRLPRELMFLYYLDVRPFYKQVQAFKQKTHIVVGTPGRVLDHMERKHWIHLLSAILLLMKRMKC